MMNTLHMQSVCRAAASPRSLVAVGLPRVHSSPRYHQTPDGASSLCISSMSSRQVVCNVKPNETAEQAYERRVQESLEVESRVINIYNEEDFHRELAQAGNKLVLLEVQSESVCDTGFDGPEREENWKIDQERKDALQKAKCVQIKNTFQRTARSCPDVTFLALEVEDDDSHTLCDKLKVDVLPTVQFYRNGKLLWQMAGTQRMEDGAALGDGVLFYGNAMADGASAEQFVTQINNKQDLQEFLNSGDDEKVLKVLDVSLTDGLGCIKIYPAVVALAKTFAGYASFGRLLGDSSPAATDIMRELHIVEAPTFIFFRGGKEVGRHVGSSRGDLIGQILQVQAAAGVNPPPPPANAAPRRSFRKKKAQTA